MTSSLPQSSRRPAVRGLLLVLAVLAGLLAMHGLAPGPSTTATPTAHSGMHARHGAVAGHGVDHCGRAVRGGAADGHADHADATCAAGGTSASYAPPALSPACGGTVPAALRHGRCGGVTATGRAPPDLAELQLLRI
ncbi:DUF6153 family protein [Streptomyces sp. NPDC019396]|uniref:DUF6153 family protein n=1 Tax=Streptomyces sp. NPDC019396 TaxID=3154687 RepID=UPI0033EE161B